MAAAITSPDRTAPAWLARVTAAACLFGAEAIHVAVMDSHFDEWLLAGLFFLAISLIEGVLAVALLATPSRAVSWLAIGVSLATVAVWLGSRTIGVSAGPAPGVEAFGLADSIASLLELLTAAALFVPSTEPASTRRSATDIFQAAMVISTVAALTLVGITQGASGHAGHSHHAAESLGQPAPRDRFMGMPGDPGLV
jgi:hypothetical protein